MPVEKLDWEVHLHSQTLLQTAKKNSNHQAYIHILIFDRFYIISLANL